MERSEILAAMGGLKLFGMKAAYDEIAASVMGARHRASAPSRRLRHAHLLALLH